MKNPKTEQELQSAITKLEKANKKWFDTERAEQIRAYKEKLKALNQ